MTDATLDTTLTVIDAGLASESSAQEPVGVTMDRAASAVASLAEVEETADPATMDTPVADRAVPFSEATEPVSCQLPDIVCGPMGEVDGEAQRATPDPPLVELVGPPPDETVDDGLHAPAVIRPAALVDALLDVAAPRRNKRRQVADVRPEAGPERPEPRVVAQHDGTGDAVEERPARVEPASTAPSADDLDDPAWRDQWPDNAVHIVAHVLPRISDAPALDGVQRTRLDLSLVEQHDGEFGAAGTLPIFVMPGAPGFGPIYREITQARRQKQRLKPMLVELQGILRQLPDRDTRYASERYTILMGVEVHKIGRVVNEAEQFAYWRGRARVIQSRRYEYKGIGYQRVTAVVSLKQRKARLRGTSITHVPVDFLVAPEHEHADRFRHIGQRLLIEAAIGGEVQRMSEHHPALEGIDDPRRKAQLQILRQSVVTVTLGEFPDEEAEREYRAWVKAGRPRPERGGRPPRGASAAAAGQGASTTTADEATAEDALPQLGQPAHARNGAQASRQRPAPERRQDDTRAHKHHDGADRSAHGR